MDYIYLWEQTFSSITDIKDYILEKQTVKSRLYTGEKKRTIVNSRGNWTSLERQKILLKDAEFWSLL